MSVDANRLVKEDICLTVTGTNTQAEETYGRILREQARHRKKAYAAD